MKKIITLYFLLIAIQSRADYWTQNANFGGVVRAAAVGFCIGSKCYIGTGWNFSPGMRDFWEYDPTTLSWTQKADFGGGNRSAAVGFAIGSKGYIGTGINGTVKNDFWQFDPDLNTWTQKANFPGPARDYAVGFELNGYGYIGTGYNAVSTSYNDFWQYNPNTDSWIQKASVGGGVRSSAIGFSIDGKGYIGTGYGAAAKSDFWEYDPVADSWTQKANAGGGARSDGTGFSVCDKGYICSGDIGSVPKKDLWEYDPLSNTWTQMASLGGSVRTNAVAFSDGTYGFIGTGFNQALNGLNDFWQYTPDCTILPIGLTRFTATQSEKEVAISWTTATEINNDYFTVEKSTNAQNFETLAVVDAVGNSTLLLNYEATDTNPANGINYYRLKQTDIDGKFSFSNVIAVNFLPGESTEQEIFSNYPNPVINTTTIIMSLKEAENVTIQLFDATGRLVFYKNVVEEKGKQNVDVDLSGFPEGIYLIHIITPFSQISNKLVKVD